jgi:hypothetical protein
LEKNSGTNLPPNVINNNIDTLIKYMNAIIIILDNSSSNSIKRNYTKHLELIYNCLNEYLEEVKRRNLKLKDSSVPFLTTDFLLKLRTKGLSPPKNVKPTGIPSAERKRTKSQNRKTNRRTRKNR